MGAVLRASGRTDKGPVRAANEDRFALDDALSLSVVADGMGGHNAGEVASRIAVDTILEVCRAAVPQTWPFGFDPVLSAAGNLLRTSVHAANARVFEAAGASDQLVGMGTTWSPRLSATDGCRSRMSATAGCTCIETAYGS